MADDKDQEPQHRASDLKLLESGNFADVTVTCGDKSWKVHKIILCSRSKWFEKALTGSFQEAIDGVVNIKEQEPEAMGLILKYIYGGSAGVDMAKYISDRSVVKLCVDMYRAADFFLLEPVLPIILRRIRDQCDQMLKRISTRGKGNDQTFSTWSEDLVIAVREAFEWDIEPIKTLLMEFIWAGRFKLLRTGYRFGLYDRLDAIPTFMKELLNHCAAKPFCWSSAWAPNNSHAPQSHRWRGTCLRCGEKLVRHDSRDGKSAVGQLVDPFNWSDNNGVLHEWCQKCASMDMIPWRENEH